MKEPFKVGDRVAVYNDGVRYVGTVANTSCDGWVDIQYRDSFQDKRGLGQMHPKQCRRLVKKERKRVFVSKKEFESHDDLIDAHKTIYAAHGDLFIEFIEVKRKDPK